MWFISYPNDIIRILEFKVACTYICTTAHYMHYYNDYNDYKIFYSNTIFYMIMLEYNAAKNQQNKIKPKKSHKKN